MKYLLLFPFSYVLFSSLFCVSLFYFCLFCLSSPVFPKFRHYLAHHPTPGPSANHNRRRRRRRREGATATPHGEVEGIYFNVIPFIEKKGRAAPPTEGRGRQHRPEEAEGGSATQTETEKATPPKEVEGQPASPNRRERGNQPHPKEERKAAPQKKEGVKQYHPKKEQPSSTLRLHPKMHKKRERAWAVLNMFCVRAVVRLTCFARTRSCATPSKSRLRTTVCDCTDSVSDCELMIQDATTVAEHGIISNMRANVPQGVKLLVDGFSVAGARCSKQGPPYQDAPGNRTSRVASIPHEALLDGEVRTAAGGRPDTRSDGGTFHLKHRRWWRRGGRSTLAELARHSGKFARKCGRLLAARWRSLDSKFPRCPTFSAVGLSPGHRRTSCLRSSSRCGPTQR